MTKPVAMHNHNPYYIDAGYDEKAPTVALALIIRLCLRLRKDLLTLPVTTHGHA